MKLIYKGEVLMNNEEGDASNPTASFPSGGIIIWSGSSDNVPDGWALCNGENGTPDLRGRFVLGESEKHSIGETGGSEEVTLTIEQMPKHNHVFNDYQYSGTNSFQYYKDNNNITTIGPTPKQLTTNVTGSSEPHPNMPPYYVLAYIMKL